MAISKVILNGETQMDVTQDTVASSNLLSGNTATGADGEKVNGGIASKTSSDMTVNGATVTAPAGYYASNASKSVASGSAKTPATTITANPTVRVNSSGLITATVSKTQSVTPSVSAGYVSSGTAGTITVTGSGTNQLTTQAAQTIHPSTTDQTIASGKYLTGAQTIKAVTTTNLTAANIVSGVTVKVGDSTDDDCVASVTGTAETGGDDFIITLTKNASTGIYEPDCTFDEAKAAFTAGKTVVFHADLPARGGYYAHEDAIFYEIDMRYTAAKWSALGIISHDWNSSGITRYDPETRKELAYYTYNATATPEDVANGKIFYNADGYQTGTAPNDFVITLTKNASTRMWEPDCTFAEAKAAYDAGKNIAFTTGSNMAVQWRYDSTEFYFAYGVAEMFSEASTHGYTWRYYEFSANGVELSYQGKEYSTSNATATPADVASGKVFYNADGRQVGTAQR